MVWDRVWLFLCLAAVAAAVDGQWKIGRATFYGTDAWSIHEGSCHYGYLWQDEPHGWDVAALSDVNSAYIGSCGRCYEVQCFPSAFRDGYGSQLDRRDVCYNVNSSVVVRITDTCPCVYPGNAYSNRRWCCGDMDHLDMSVWAYEKLADKRWGVIGIRYRPVPCTFTPEVVAPPARNPTPGVPPPPGAKKVNRGYNWQFTADSALQIVWSSVPHSIYVNGPKQGWTLSTDSASSHSTDSPLGIMGGANALCANLEAAGGHLDIASSAPGAWVGASMLEVWVNKQPYDMVPALALELLLVGGKAAASCRSLHLNDLMPANPGTIGHNGSSSRDGSWARFVIALTNFKPASSGSCNVAATTQASSVGNATSFAGCGPAAPVERLGGLRLRNTLAVQQLVCVDGLRLVTNVADY